MKTFVTHCSAIQPGCGVPEVGVIKGPPPTPSVGDPVPSTVPPVPKSHIEGDVFVSPGAGGPESPSPGSEPWP